MKSSRPSRTSLLALAPLAAVFFTASLRGTPQNPCPPDGNPDPELLCPVWNSETCQYEESESGECCTDGTVAGEGQVCCGPESATTATDEEECCPSYSEKTLGFLTLSFSEIGGTSGEGGCSYSTTDNLTISLAGQSIDLSDVSIEWEEDDEQNVSSYSVTWTGTESVTLGAVEFALSNVTFTSEGESTATLTPNVTEEVEIGPLLKLQPGLTGDITYTFSGSTSSGTWDFSPISNFVVHMKKDETLLAIVTADSLTVDGLVTNAEFDLQESVTFDSGGFTLELIDLNFSMDFDIMEAEATLNEGDATAEVTNITGLTTDSKIELELTIDTSGTITAEAALDLEDAENKMSVSQLRFTAESIVVVIDSEFNITSIEGSGVEISHADIKAADGGSSAALYCDFLITSGSLESITVDESHIIYKNKFSFEIANGSYDSQTSQVNLTASLNVGDVFSFDLDAFSKTSDGYSVGQMNVNFDRAPLKVNGDFSYDTGTNNFSGNLGAHYVHKGSDYGMTGELAFGSSGQNASQFNYAYAALSLNAGAGVPLGNSGLRINSLAGEAGYHYRPSAAQGGTGSPDSSVTAIFGAGMGIRDVPGVVQINSYVQVELGDDSGVTLNGTVRVPATGQSFATGQISVEYDFGDEELRGNFDSQIQVPAGSGSVVRADSGSVEFAVGGENDLFMVKAESITGEIFSSVSFEAMVRFFGRLDSASVIDSGTIQGNFDYSKDFSYRFPANFDATDCASADATDAAGLGISGTLTFDLNGVLNAEFNQNGFVGAVNTYVAGSNQVKYKWPCIVVCADDCLKQGQLNFSGTLQLEKSGSQTRISGTLTFVEGGESESADVNFIF